MDFYCMDFAGEISPITADEVVEILRRYGYPQARISEFVNGSRYLFAENKYYCSSAAPLHELRDQLAPTAPEPYGTRDVMHAILGASI